MALSPTLKTAGARKTRRTDVVDRLFRMITSPEPGLGDRLPAVEDLAERFGASVGTVHLALEDLEAKGYLIKKHGAGTFIACQHRPFTLKDAVAVCMDTSGHTWSELWAMIMNGLNERHLFPLGIEMTHQSRADLFKKFNHTEAGCYIVQGSYDVPFELFKTPAFQNKPVISVVGWESEFEWPGLYRVLTDYDGGGAMAARYLWSQEHRNVLVVGPPTDRWVAAGTFPLKGSPLPGFVRTWESGGGVWEQQTSESRSQPDTPLNEEQLVATLKRRDRPTAIFGTRDYEVWQAQQIIRRRLPELEGRIELVGYCDTPWSRAGAPPFTTVGLELRKIADEAMKILDAIRAGDSAPQKKPVMIRPTLLVRE
jgi:DNA-binding transcriptional regulator YhcF (GntR family)